MRLLYNYSLSLNIPMASFLYSFRLRWAGGVGLEDYIIILLVICIAIQSLRKRLTLFYYIIVQNNGIMCF